MTPRFKSFYESIFLISSSGNTLSNLDRSIHPHVNNFLSNIGWLQQIVGQTLQHFFFNNLFQMFGNKVEPSAKRIIHVPTFLTRPIWLVRLTFPTPSLSSSQTSTIFVIIMAKMLRNSFVNSTQS